MSEQTKSPEENASTRSPSNSGSASGTFPDAVPDPHAFFSRFRRAAASFGGPYLALIVLLLVCGISSDVFLRTANLMNILRQVSYSGLIALGMTFVIVGGGIDLSVGSLFAFSGVGAILAMNHFTPVLTAFAAAHPFFTCLGDPETTGMIIGLCSALLIALAGGAINAAAIVFGRLPPFIATLGTYSIFRSLSLVLADAGTIGTENSLIGRIGGAEFFDRLPLPALLLLFLTAFFALLLAKTAFGRHVCALGANERVARFAGVHTMRVKFITYLISGLCVGLGAFLFIGRLSSVSSSNAGMLYELDAIAAVIIGGAPMAGGRGNLWGTLAGILILGIVSNILDMWGVSGNWQGAVKGLVIIISVLIQRKEKTL